LLICLQIVGVDSVMSVDIFRKLEAREGIDVKPLTLAHRSGRLSTLSLWLTPEQENERSLYSDTHQSFLTPQPYHPYSKTTMTRLNRFRANTQAVWNKATEPIKNNLESSVVRSAVMKVGEEIKDDLEQMPNTQGDSLDPTSHRIFESLAARQLEPDYLPIEIKRGLCYLAIFETLRYAKELDADIFLGELMFIAVLTNRMGKDLHSDLDASIEEVISLFKYMIQSKSNPHDLPILRSSDTDSYNEYILEAYQKIISGQIQRELKDRVQRSTISKSFFQNWMDHQRRCFNRLDDEVYSIVKQWNKYIHKVTRGTPSKEIVRVVMAQVIIVFAWFRFR
jgi:hypothetical protein